MSAPAAERPAGEPSTVDEAGPPLVRPRRRLRRLVFVSGGVVLLLVGLVAGAITLVLHRFDAAVTRATLLEPGARAAEPAPAVRHAPVTGPLNLLLLGSDYNPDDPGNGQRSDTIIVVHIDAALGHVYLVSIPRDLLVRIPPQPESGFHGDRTKINAAFSYGHGGASGAQLASATVTDLTGVRFDGAALIDFVGLMRVVDLLGGVTMCVDAATVSIHTNHAFDVGCGTMTSGEVLDYLRQRNFPDGDFSRQRHQQQFLRAVVEEFGAGVLTNPARLDALLQALAGAMTVDLGVLRLSDLVFALAGLDGDDITGLQVPTYATMMNDVSYQIATDEALGLWDAIRTDALAEWAAVHPDWVNKI